MEITIERRRQLIESAVDALMLDVERHSRRGESFEYLGDPGELVARRGSLSALRVA